VTSFTYAFQPGNRLVLFWAELVTNQRFPLMGLSFWPKLSQLWRRERQKHQTLTAEPLAALLDPVAVLSRAAAAAAAGPAPGDDCRANALDLKPLIDWLTPSARKNCSRSSMFVLPLATSTVVQWTHCKLLANEYSWVLDASQSVHHTLPSQDTRLLSTSVCLWQHSLSSAT